MERKKALNIALLAVFIAAVLAVLLFLFDRKLVIEIASLGGALISIILVLNKLEMTRNIAEAKFIANINSSFVSNADYKRVYTALDNYHRLLRSDASGDALRRAEKVIEDLDNVHISNYLTFFEVLNVLRKKGTMNISTIDDLFAYRFFIAVRNKCIYRRKILSGNFNNIIELQSVWEKYRRSKGVEIYGEDVGCSEKFTFSHIGTPHLSDLIAVQEDAFAEMPDKRILRRNSESVLEDCLKNHYVMGAFHCDELVGFGVLYFAGDGSENLVQHAYDTVDDYDCYANMKLVIVKRKYRGHGLQRSIMSSLENIPAQREVREVFATVSPENIHSEANLLAMGYRKIKLLKNKYDGADRNLFSKTI